MFDPFRFSYLILFHTGVYLISNSLEVHEFFFLIHTLNTNQSIKSKYDLCMSAWFFLLLSVDTYWVFGISEA